MKTILRLLAVVAVVMAVTACNGKDKPNGKLLDKDAMVYINVNDGKNTRVANPDLPDNPEHLTPHELVAKAESMIITSPSSGPNSRLWLGGIIEEGEPLTKMGRKAGEYQYKLLDEAKFVFWGDFIIDKDYKTEEPVLVEEFFKAKDVRFYDKEGNIIGYIPQRILKDAWERIQKHFNAKEYDAVYQIFRDTYQAFPCTTDEWNKLKEEGKN